MYVPNDDTFKWRSDEVEGFFEGLLRVRVCYDENGLLSFTTVSEQIHKDQESLDHQQYEIDYDLSQHIELPLICIYVTDIKNYNIQKITLVNQSRVYIDSGVFLDSISIEYIHCNVTLQKVIFDSILGTLSFVDCVLEMHSTPMLYFKGINKVIFANTQFIFYDDIFANTPMSNGFLEFDGCLNILFNNCETKSIQRNTFD